MDINTLYPKPLYAKVREYVLNMSLKAKIAATIIAVLILVLLTAGIYFLQMKINAQKAANAAKKAATDVESTINSINQNIANSVAPKIDTTVNPMENAPDLNPYQNTNPFADVKINPFK